MLEPQRTLCKSQFWSWLIEPPLRVCEDRPKYKVFINGKTHVRRGKRWKKVLLRTLRFQAFLELVHDDPFLYCTTPLLYRDKSRLYEFCKYKVFEAYHESTRTSKYRSSAPWPSSNPSSQSFTNGKIHGGKRWKKVYCTFMDFDADCSLMLVLFAVCVIHRKVNGYYSLWNGNTNTYWYLRTGLDPK